MLLTKFRDVLITRLKYLIILFNLYFGNLMSSLENIVESSWNFLKKKSLEIGLCASLLIGASGCGEDKRDQQIQKKEASKTASKETKNDSSLILGKWIGSTGEIVEAYKDGTISISLWNGEIRKPVVGDYSRLNDESIKVNIPSSFGKTKSSIWKLSDFTANSLVVKNQKEAIQFRRYDKGQPNLIVSELSGKGGIESIVLSAEEGEKSTRPFLISFTNKGEGVICWKPNMRLQKVISYHPSYAFVGDNDKIPLFANEAVSLSLIIELGEGDVFNKKDKYKGVFTLTAELGEDNIQEKTIPINIIVKEQQAESLSLDEKVSKSLNMEEFKWYKFDSKANTPYLITSIECEGEKGWRKHIELYDENKNILKRPGTSPRFDEKKYLFYKPSTDKQILIKMIGSRAGHNELKHAVSFYVSKVEDSVTFHDNRGKGTWKTTGGRWISDSFDGKAGAQYLITVKSPYTSSGELEYYISNDKALDKFEKEGVARQMEKVLVRNIHNPYSEDETCDVWSCKEDGKYWFVMNAGRFSEHIYNEQRPINANIQIYKLPSK